MERGANTSAADKFGNTALHVAVKIKNLEAVYALLRYCQNVSVPNKNGSTALDLVLPGNSTRKDASGYPNDNFLRELLFPQENCGSNGRVHIFKGYVLACICTHGEGSRLNYTHQYTSKSPSPMVKGPGSTTPTSTQVSHHHPW
ncbi:uncharacterized protein [Procambarus clarkii]|uniref:uncharacterized protein n=1 Tax=Procambarus clarkii TaxID=6728 RepID=UPI0037428E3F